MPDLFDTAPLVAQTRKVINDAFASYLRTCRSGGMPLKVSEKVQASYNEFARVYLSEALATSALLQGADWEPIESAPTDTDEAFLLYAENVGWEFFVCKFLDGHWRTLDSDYDPFIKGLSQPTLWRRLQGPIPTDLAQTVRTPAQEYRMRLRMIGILASSTGVTEAQRLEQIKAFVASALSDV